MAARARVPDGRIDGMAREERALLERIVVQIERCSAYQHQLAKRGRVLREAATQLRLGRKVQAVLNGIQEQVPDAVLTVTGGGEPVTVPAQHRRLRRRSAAERRHEDWLRRQIEGLGNGEGARG